MSHQTKKKIGAVIISIVAIIQAVAMSGNGIVLLEASGRADAVSEVKLEKTSEGPVESGLEQTIIVTARNHTDIDQEICLLLSDESGNGVEDITAAVKKYPKLADDTQIAVRWNNMELLPATEDTFTVRQTVTVDAGQNAADTGLEAAVTEERYENPAEELTENEENDGAVDADETNLKTENDVDAGETERNQTGDAEDVNEANEAEPAGEAEDREEPEDTEDTGDSGYRPADKETEAYIEADTETAEDAAEEDADTGESEEEKEPEITDDPRSYITLTLPAEAEISFELILAAPSVDSRTITVKAAAYSEGLTDDLLQGTAEGTELALVWETEKDSGTISEKEISDAEVTEETTGTEETEEESTEDKTTAPVRRMTFSGTADGTGETVTIFFDPNDGTKSWSTKSNLYIYMWNDTEGTNRWDEMSTMLIGDKTYFYYQFPSSDMEGFLFCTQKGWGSGRDQTQDQTFAGTINGKVYYISTASGSNSNWAKLSTKSITDALGIQSAAGRTISLVDMRGENLPATVTFTNPMGEEEPAAVENGQITIPADPASGVPYTDFSLNGSTVSLYDATDGVQGSFNSDTNVFYYGATTDKDGNVIASRWAGANDSNSLDGKTLYFDTSYKVSINNTEKELTENHSLGVRTAYTCTFQDGEATTDTILTAVDPVTGYNYHFYWTDTSYDLLVIDADNLANVSDHHESLEGTAIHDENELKNIANQSGNYYLANDFTFGSNATIRIGGNVTLDLNGHRITTSGQLFTVANGGQLSIVDSVGAVENVEVDAVKPSYAAWTHTGDVTVNRDNVTVTYYVTDSEIVTQATSKGTADTRYKHTDIVKGSIVTDAGMNQVIQVEAGGTFRMEGGAITTKGQYIQHIILNNGTFEMLGGYLVGASSTDDGGGAAVYNYADNAQGQMTMSGGVIANNTSSKNGGAISNVRNATLTVNGGVISCNSCGTGYDGGGIYSDGGTLSVNGGYITNNTANGNASFSDDSTYGGGGIAILNGTFSMTGGYVTGNVSVNAGGGIYIGNWGSSETYSISGGIIAKNLNYVGEGGGIRVSNQATGTISGSTYITNNENWTGYGKESDTAAGTSNSGTWGGGGVFVQEGGTLNLLAALITDNEAKGFGGGFAACPTGDVTSVSNDGAAIYGNTADMVHMSATTGHGKNKDVWLKEGWSEYGYTQDREKAYFNQVGNAADYFSAGVGSVVGYMLGDTAANWSGLLNYQSVQIGKYDTGKAGSVYRNNVDTAYVGLTADPTEADQATATALATVVISGNYSYTHGGGIMTNGTVNLGTVPSEKYPDIHLTGNKRVTEDGKEVAAADLTAEQYAYRFEVARGSIQVIRDEIVFIPDAETAVIATMEDGGTFKLDWTIGSSDLTDRKAVYYLTEINDNAEDTAYDATIYRITVELNSDTERIGNTVQHTVGKITIETPTLKNNEIIWNEVTDYAKTSNSNYSQTIAFDSGTFHNVITHEYSLPVTGGPGTTALALGGAALIMSGTLSKYRKKRRNERRISNQKESS